MSHTGEIDHGMRVCGPVETYLSGPARLVYSLLVLAKRRSIRCFEGLLSVLLLGCKDGESGPGFPVRLSAGFPPPPSKSEFATTSHIMWDAEQEAVTEPQIYVMKHQQQRLQERDMNCNDRLFTLQHLANRFVVSERLLRA